MDLAAKDECLVRSLSVAMVKLMMSPALPCGFLRALDWPAADCRIERGAGLWSRFGRGDWKGLGDRDPWAWRI